MSFKKSYKKTSGYTPISKIGECSLKKLEFGIIELEDGESVAYDTENKETAFRLLEDLNLSPIDNLNKMSKGMIEKLQLILVMSREADLYVLDEPLGGVDPATRDYILDTILSNFKNGASIIISTHLIQDIERILDDVIFVDKGKIILTGSCDELRKKHNESIDEIFRRMFKC